MLSPSRHFKTQLSYSMYFSVSTRIKAVTDSYICAVPRRCDESPRRGPLGAIARWRLTYRSVVTANRGEAADDGCRRNEGHSQRLRCLSACRCVEVEPQTIGFPVRVVGNTHLLHLITGACLPYLADPSHKSVGGSYYDSGGYNSQIL